MSDFTHKNFDFNEPGHEWNAVVSFKDDQPIEVGIYVWKVDSPWEKTMEEDLSRVLGYKVKMSNMYVGNGHGGADLKKVENNDSNQEHQGCNHGCP